MKKLTAIITLVITIALTSCLNKNQNFEKLPLHISWDVGDFVFNAGFEYDHEGRITKMIKKDVQAGEIPTTITYQGKKSVKMETVMNHTTEVKEYIKKGNTITITNYDDYIKTYKMTLDKNEYITNIRIDFSGDNEYLLITYRYDSGNLIDEVKVWYHGDVQTHKRNYKYKFDDKKSPFINSNTPKWVLHELLGTYSWTDSTPFVNVNNVVGMTVDEDIHDFKADYDSDGYLRSYTTPTKLSKRSADITISYSESAIQQLTASENENKFDDKIWFTATGTELKVTLATPETESQFPEISKYSDVGNHYKAVA